jgi:hypothetical protein
MIFNSIDKSKIISHVNNLRRAVEDNNYKIEKCKIPQLIDLHKTLLLAYFDMSISQLESSNFCFLDGTDLNSTISRIVIGAHGPYAEFKSLNFKTIVPKNQTWRYYTNKNIKYFHLQPVNRTEKIYRQIKRVNYADYLPNHFYIDLYLLKPI